MQSNKLQFIREFLEFMSARTYRSEAGSTIRFFMVVMATVLTAGNIKAQNDNSAFCVSHYINPRDSNTLHLDIENGNYFKNMYYTFNDFEAGYKEIGYFIQPALAYYPNGRTKLTAGIYLLKYSGLSNYPQEQPVFSFQYHICNGLDMVLGPLYGSVNHHLI